MDPISLDLKVPGGDTLNTAFGKVQTGFDQLIRDLAAGLLTGWDATVTSPDQPTRIDYAQGTLVLRENYIYDDAPNNDRIKSVQYRISTNSGVDFTTYATVTYAFDGNGNVTGWTWS